MSGGRPARRSRRAGDSGSAGLLALWAALVVLSVAGAGALYGGAVASRHRATAAADLAALAAASSAARGSAQPCDAAGRVAGAQRARLESCHLAGDGSVLVEVTVRVPGLVGLLGARLGPARARARAGPAT